MSRLTGLFLVAVAVGSLPAFGDAITADGTYHEFTWGTDAGFPVAGIGCGPANILVCTATTNPAAERNSVSPWTFTGAGSLFVLDVADIGDRFQIFDDTGSGPALILTTSATSGNTNPCGFDIACSILNDTANVANGYSFGQVALGSGNHSLTVSVISGFTTGQAVFSLSAAQTSVPEPATAGMMGVALLGLGLWGRRSRRR